MPINTLDKLWSVHTKDEEPWEQYTMQQCRRISIVKFEQSSQTGKTTHYVKLHSYNIPNQEKLNCAIKVRMVVST